MNIYFSGIGGVGLGPLAEIAHDAGYSVVGSDPKPGLMTNQLHDRGVTVGADQSGAFLRASHAEHPIDWLVYTSALPATHPELVTARELGIKTTKRDELLAHIIAEKHLKLIAVAGTHGKTTTSSLFVWAFQQLGIPISYSVGTTLSFGTSGKYDPESEYFVYECDEYDRNFLQFHPFLAVIPALSYDHPDTYPTQDDYNAAFQTFLSQSQASIVWEREAVLLGNLPHAWVLNDHDVASVTLAGDHIRRNASLVVKAFERLTIDGDVVGALNSFPGADRRFEELADNLYTDYAVHPREIAATIAMAHELNEHVVAVYEPHQNVRQHEVADGYTAEIFDQADDVYWLPTYLTREDPELETLTPAQLTKNIPREKRHIAALNEHLWSDIQRHRDAGHLVLCMGAGTIDGWLREQLAIKTVGNVLVVSHEGMLLLQQRDDKPGINNPGMLSAFGGDCEPGDESPRQTALRELREETNITATADQLTYLASFYKSAVIDGTPRWVSYYTVTDVDAATLEVYEGQGFVSVDPNAIDETLPFTELIAKAIAAYTDRHITSAIPPTKASA